MGRTQYIPMTMICIGLALTLIITYIFHAIEFGLTTLSPVLATYPYSLPARLSFLLHPIMNCVKFLTARDLELTWATMAGCLLHVFNAATAIATVESDTWDSKYPHLFIGMIHSLVTVTATYVTLPVLSQSRLLFLRTFALAVPIALSIGFSMVTLIYIVRAELMPFELAATIGVVEVLGLAAAQVNAATGYYMRISSAQVTQPQIETRSVFTVVGAK